MAEDEQMAALEALLQQIALQDDVAGVVLVRDDGTLVACAGDPDAVDATLVDTDPDELEHFEKDGLGATAIAAGARYGVRAQRLVGGKLRLAIGFDLGADLDAIKALGQQAGLEAMTLFKRIRSG